MTCSSPSTLRPYSQTCSTLKFARRSLAIWLSGLALLFPTLAQAHTLPEAGRVTEIVLVPRPSPRPVAPTQRRPPLDRLGNMPYDSIVEVPESVLREPTELRTDAGYTGRFVEDLRVIDIPDFQFPRRDLWEKPATIQRLNSRYLYLSANDLEPTEGQASRPGYVRMRVRQQSRIYQSEFRTRPLYTGEDAVRAVEQGRRVVEGQPTPCPSPTAATDAAEKASSRSWRRHGWAWRRWWWSTRQGQRTFSSLIRDAGGWVADLVATNVFARGFWRHDIGDSAHCATISAGIGGVSGVAHSAVQPAPARVTPQQNARARAKLPRPQKGARPRAHA